MIPNSKSYFNLLKQFTPCGSQTLSKMPNRYIEGVYPMVLERGKGGHVWDVDGNEYIDLVAGLGCISVGYANEQINDKLWMQLMKGVSFSFPNALEYLVARKLTELVPGTEMWKFGKNGTDANIMAVRCARAYTGRTKIMTVGYNGCADQFEVKGTRNAGVPKIIAETMDRANFGSIKSFDSLRYKDYACVLLEPMVYEEDRAFLSQLRELCTKTGTLLILDEVVTGGRDEYFVAQTRFGICPDLTTLSKGIANGLPLSAVGGSRAIMSTFERDDFFASGTFGGECLSLAAFLATQDILCKQIPDMISKGQRIKDVFNKEFKELGGTCKGYPTRLTFDFESKVHKAEFMQEMCLEGILTGYSNFIMADHTNQDVEQILSALTKVAYRMKADIVMLRGPLPVEALRMRKQ